MSAYLYLCVLPIFFILGNIANLLSLIIFSRKSWKKNVCVFYFKVFLICNTCYINTSILGVILNNDLQVNLQNRYVIICKVYFYVSFVFSTLIPCILISSQNVDTRLYSSKRLTCLSLSISIVFWFIFYLHLPISVTLQQYESSSTICFDFNINSKWLFFFNFDFCLYILV